jgi:hypothetical protein
MQDFTRDVLSQRLAAGKKKGGPLSSTYQDLEAMTTRHRLAFQAPPNLPILLRSVPKVTADQFLRISCFSFQKLQKDEFPSVDRKRSLFLAPNSPRPNKKWIDRRLRRIFQTNNSDELTILSAPSRYHDSLTVALALFPASLAITALSMTHVYLYSALLSPS